MFYIIIEYTKWGIMNNSYTSITKPSKSDPYWYEWSVGEMNLLDMLYEERRNYKIIVPQIFINRELGEKVSTTKKSDSFKSPVINILYECKNQHH